MRRRAEPLGQRAGALGHDHVLGPGTEADAGEELEILGIDRGADADQVTGLGQEQRPLGIAVEAGDGRVQGPERAQRSHAMDEDSGHAESGWEPDWSYSDQTSERDGRSLPVASKGMRATEGPRSGRGQPSTGRTARVASATCCSVGAASATT